MTGVPDTKKGEGIFYFQRKSGQFIMLKYSYASVHSICTSDTSSSLSSALLRRSSVVVIEHAQ